MYALCVIDFKIDTYDNKNGSLPELQTTTKLCIFRRISTAYGVIVLYSSTMQPSYDSIETCQGGTM